MGAEIDRLEVQVEAQATKANNALDKLVGNLEKLEASLTHINASGLSGLSSGISKFTNASAQLSSIDSRKFDTIAKNIDKLSTFNTQQLYGASHAMRTLANSINSLGGVSSNSLQVAQVANSISKLGGANVQKAIVNLPQLAVAMNNLMGTLAKAPQVSNNVIAMTRALANLASQGEKVGTASKGLIGSLNQTGNAMTANTKKAFSLSSAIGKLYQSYYWVMRAGNGLWDSVESTSDYIEAYNYFDVTLGKIGSEWAHQWEDYADKIGVASAEEYANSFQTRLSQSLSKLSGVQIDIGADGSGLLTETGMKNLGLNIQEVTQYASQLASVTNSVGQTGEVSLAAASAFTKLGADMSSLFNVDYSSVMKNLQSGLIGQSRALYKYGIDITNATLQTYAYELELGKAVSEMTQAEKMQLRMLAILDQSKVSWGDLANTINSPSNMIRQFGNNMKEAGMVLGQLFIPALQKVLPVANGLAIAFKQLFVSIASLLGIKLDLGSFGQGYTDLEEDIDGVSDGFEQASNAAKKLKGQLQGFDELNVIKSQDSSGAGAAGGVIDLTKEILEATAEYEKAWAEAYEKMQNKAQEFADKIARLFKPITDPLGMMLLHLRFGGWSQAGEYFSDAAIELLQMLRKTIGTVDWGAVGEDIGKFLKNVDWAKVIAESVKLKIDIATALADVWFGSLEVAPFETVLLTVFGAMKFTKLGPFVAGKIGTAISSALVSMGGISGLMTTDIATIVGTGTAAEIGVAFGTAVIGGIGAAFAGFEFGKVIGQWINPEDESWYENFSWFGDDGFFKTISSDWSSTFDGLTKMTNDFKNNPVIAWLSSGVMASLPGLNVLFWAGKLGAIKDEIFRVVDETTSKWGEKISTWWEEDVSPWLSKEKWITLGENLKDGIFDGFKGISNNVIGILNDVIAGLEKMLNTAIGGINEMLSGLNDSALAEYFDFKIEVAEVTFGRIPTFSVGGFPEDGLFFANHSELVGKFSNGKTAVANNEQIIEGIKYGVREAVSEVLAPYLADIAQNTRETADKEFGITEEDVTSAVVHQNRIFYNRTGITILES